MKNTILTIIILLLGLQVDAQTGDKIIPIENFYSYRKAKDRIPEGTKLKDIHHLLDKYEGSWIGTYQNMNYKLLIEKTTRYFHKIYLDALLVRMRITNPSGKVVENTLNDKDDSAYLITGEAFDREDSSLYSLYYMGKDSNCGNSGTIYIGISANHSKMKLHVLPDDVMISDEECPKGYQAPPFPDETETPMTLTKQE